MIHLVYKPPAFPKPPKPPKQRISPLAKVVAANILKQAVHAVTPIPRPATPPLLPRHFGPPEGPLGENAHLGWQPPVTSDPGILQPGQGTSDPIQLALIDQFLKNRTGRIY